MRRDQNIKNSKVKKTDDNMKSKKNKNNLDLKTKIKERLHFDKRMVIISIIIVLAIVLWILFANYTTFGIVLNRNITDNDVVKIELANSNNRIYEYKNEVLVYNAGNMATYNRYGEKTWSTYIEDTIEADISTSGKYIQVINKDKGIIYIYDNKNISSRIAIKGDILSGNINNSGMSAIEYGTAGAKTVIGLYNKKGEAKYNVKLSNNIIGEYILSDDSRYLAYVDVDISGISASSNINLVDLKSVNDKTFKVKKIYTNDNSLVYDLEWNHKKLICRLDGEYIIYNTIFDSKEKIDISNDNILNIDTDGYKYVYTKVDKNNDPVFNIRKIGADSSKLVKIKDLPKYFIYENGVVFVCYQKQIVMYNNFGAQIKKYDSSMVITKPVVFNNGKSIAIMVSNKLVLFTI